MQAFRWRVGPSIREYSLWHHPVGGGTAQANALLREALDPRKAARKGMENLSRPDKHRKVGENYWNLLFLLCNKLILIEILDYKTF